MAPKQIEGEILDPEDDVVRLLKVELSKVRQELNDERANASHREGQAVQAIKALRQQLTPLYRAFQMVFGEIDTVVSEATANGHQATGSGLPQHQAWVTWQQKLGVNSPASRMISVLLDHGPSTTRQIQAAAKMGEATVYKAASKLGQLQLIEKQGGRYVLKPLKPL